MDSDEVDNAMDESYLIVNGKGSASFLSVSFRRLSREGRNERTMRGSDEAEKSGSASQAVSEESVHETASDTTAKKLDKELEPTDETAKENNATALDDINVAINGEIGDTPSENSTQLMEHLQSALSINSESNQPLIQADENVSDNETESDVKENVESERTSEVKPSEDEEEQKESSSDTEESSDFVDAEAINGVEMLPSSAVNDDDSDKVDSSAEKRVERKGKSG
ncbi:hypothetical protein OS493_003996 [Desmophyllum pertusum]|uniref:Uncharacterized protein n=1 Tax=Desmophyllum pertusum TaxID=174260 RepID=A0A9W9ZSB9_9CNID|nr:hypothetical protein OS493_003996 [Desmophyllum pertusum]